MSRDFWDNQRGLKTSEVSGSGNKMLWEFTYADEKIQVILVLRILRVDL
jgi:hypothetical protein